MPWFIHSFIPTIHSTGTKSMDPKVEYAAFVAKHKVPRDASCFTPLCFLAIKTTSSNHFRLTFNVMILQSDVFEPAPVEFDAKLILDDPSVAHLSIGSDIILSEFTEPSLKVRYCDILTDSMFFIYVRLQDQAS